MDITTIAVDRESARNLERLTVELKKIFMGAGLAAETFIGRAPEPETEALCMVGAACAPFVPYTPEMGYSVAVASDGRIRLRIEAFLAHPQGSQQPAPGEGAGRRYQGSLGEVQDLLPRIVHAFVCGRNSA